MIWIIGNRGMLGREIQKLLEKKGKAFTASDTEVSILDKTALMRYSVSMGINHIINCAAYTNVDKSEDEPEKAMALNRDGPENLARLASELGARLIHISTDYVFDGNAKEPYSEDAEPGPLGVYGRTKAEGEARVLEQSEDAIIVRTAWLYGEHGPNFVKTMQRLLAEREEISVVSDQEGSPTWARDLANTIIEICSRPEFEPGIYHFTNAGITNWYEFAREIQTLSREAGILKTDCKIKPISTSEYPTKARRPAWSALSTQKLSKRGIAVPPWQESLKKYITGIE